MNVDLGSVLVVMFVGGLVSGVIASSRGLGFGGYFVIGCLIPILGVLLAMVAPGPGPWPGRW